jgi:RNA polymerase sigma-70 factor (ECF subfamily)
VTALARLVLLIVLVLPGSARRRPNQLRKMHAACAAPLVASSFCDRYSFFAEQMASLPTQPEGAPNQQGAPAAGPGPDAAAAAQEPGFREIHDAYFGFVWRYAANRGVPAMAIDDVVQEVFVVVHNRLQSFEGRSSLKTWLAGIAYNVVRGYVRKPGNRPAGDYLDEEQQLLAHGASPAEALERKRALEMLDHLLDKMSDVQREVFILCEIEQLSSVEIAEALGINENTVRTRLLAARKLFNAGVARQQASQKWWRP